MYIITTLNCVFYSEVDRVREGKPAMYRALAPLTRSAGALRRVATSAIAQQYHQQPIAIASTPAHLWAPSTAISLPGSSLPVLRPLVPIEPLDVLEPIEGPAIEASSTLKKRRLKMNKHKYRKRRKRDRRRTK